MLGINCLHKNTPVVQNLEKIVEYVGYQTAAATGKATLLDVYNQIIQMGVEVDLRTIGLIYAQVLPTTDAAFDSVGKIERQAGNSFLNLASAIMQNAPIVENETIGRLSPEEWVAKSLSNMFYSAHADKTVHKSDMVVLRNAMLRGAKRFLGELPKQPKNQDDFYDIISKAFAMNRTGFDNNYGGLNSIAELFDATLEELDKYSNEIGSKGSPATIAQWRQYVQDLRNATYTGLLFGQKEAERGLIQMMKDAGFGKTLSNGKTIIDWVKMAGGIKSVGDIRDNVEKVLTGKGFTQSAIDAVKTSMVREFHSLQAEVLKKAQEKLNNKRKAGQKKSVKKSDLMKLSELHSLGVFNGLNNDLIFKALGVGTIDRADMRELEEISRDIATLSSQRSNAMFSSYAFQVLQSRVNTILTRNINNKSKLLAIVSAISKFFQLQNFGRVANAYNMLENNLSGLKEWISTEIQIIATFGVKEGFKDIGLMKDVWVDVAKGGHKYGTEDGQFSSQDFIDDRIKERDTFFKKVGYYVTAVGRAFLSASDAAFKATIHTKTMQLMIYQALVDNGKTHDEALEFMNEALYGQKLEDARILATNTLQQFNIPATKQAVTRLAYDLIKANLSLGGPVTEDMIVAANKSTFNVASMSLGHKSQKGMWKSVDMEEGRKKRAKAESELIKNQEWGHLALHRFNNVLIYSIMMPFMRGIFNWMLLRAQSNFGLGIVTGSIGLQKLRDNSTGDSLIDYTSKESIEKTMESLQSSRQQIARGITGLTYTGVIYAIVAAIAQGTDDDDDKDSAMTELMKAIRANPILHKMIQRSAPDIMTWHYNVNNSKTATEGSVKYFQQFFNLGSSYSFAGQSIDIAKSLARGQNDRAEGEIGAVLGSRVEIPMWKPYKGFYYLGEGIVQAAQGKKVTGEKWTHPDSYMNGIFGGGGLEDMYKLTGFGYKRERPTSSLKHIGESGKQQLKEMGVNNIFEVRQHHLKRLKTKDGKKMLTKKEIREINEQIFELEKDK